MDLKLEEYWAVIRGRVLKRGPTPEEIEEGIRQARLRGPRGERDGEFTFIHCGVEYRGRVLEVRERPGKRVSYHIEAEVFPVGYRGTSV
jgi:hypothetical protein